MLPAGGANEAVSSAQSTWLCTWLVLEGLVLGRGKIVFPEEAQSRGGNLFQGANLPHALQNVLL